MSALGPGQQRCLCISDLPAWLCYDITVLFLFCCDPHGLGLWGEAGRVSASTEVTAALGGWLRSPWEWGHTVSSLSKAQMPSKVKSGGPDCCRWAVSGAGWAEVAGRHAVLCRGGAGSEHGSRSPLVRAAGRGALKPGVLTGEGLSEASYKTHWSANGTIRFSVVSASCVQFHPL